jgi:hypothetical protein
VSITTDWRALCAELVEDIEEWMAGTDHCPPSSMTLVKRARAALAQPEPQGPSDEELWDLYQDLGSYFSPTEFARTVLARWGRPAIEPVPQQDDVHYAWELHDAEGEWQAGGSANSLDDVQREGNRYLQTYSQDGPHKLIIERHCVTTIEPVPGVEGKP